jgi:hypothetical protein
LHPGQVRLDTRGVDHQQIILRPDAVGIEVIDHTAALIAHQGVLALADG